MLRSKDISRLISADRQNCEIKFSEYLSKLFENSAISSISRVEYLFLVGSLDHKPSPKPLVCIRNPSLSPVTHRHKGDFESLTLDLMLVGLSPIQFDHFGSLRKYISGIGSCKEGWFELILQSIQRVLIKVVIVIVTHEDRVDEGQLLNFASWSSESFGTHELKRRGPLGKDWIDQKIDIFSDRYDGCGMADPCVL